MKNIVVISPKVSKESASLLASSIGAKYLQVNRDMHYDLSQFDAVINYGYSGSLQYNKIINRPILVKHCVNKITTLKSLSPLCSTIQWTENREEALEWLINDEIVVARAQVKGNQGAGLSYCNTMKEFEEAPAKFWSKYFHHIHEVRVNVYKGTVFGLYRKDYEENEKGETLFNFIPMDYIEHPDLTHIISAIQQQIGIDMYGIDVLVNKYNRIRLLEINTGFILHPSSIKKLGSLIKKDLT